MSVKVLRNGATRLSVCGEEFRRSSQAVATMIRRTEGLACLPDLKRDVMSAETSRPPLMRWFGNLSVQLKIATAAGLALLAGLTVGVSGLTALSRTNDATQQLYGSNVASLTAIGEVRTAALQTRIDIINHAVSLDDKTKTHYESAVRQDQDELLEKLTRYQTTHPAGDPAVIESVGALWGAYKTLFNEEFLPASRRNDLSAWQKIRDTQGVPLFKKIMAALDALTNAERADAAGAAKEAQSSFESSRLQTLILLTVGLVLGLGASLIVARGIVRSLNRVRAVAESLAACDLTRTADLDGADEVARTGQALDRAIGILRESVGTINASAVSLAGASQQMSSVSTQIAASAEETSVQASSVSAAAGEVSSSVQTVAAAGEQMTSSIQEIARNANDAAQVANEAVHLTLSTNTTVGKLGESSAEIGNVVATITSIAEQTNLLALNATIEAARAGVAGKGFAVVATEVKELAHETARATEDIAQRVQSIQTDAAGAVRAIEQISAVIARISDFQTTIASAVEEQTATTSETNQSVARAAQGVDDIAANIDGVAQASQSLSQGVTEAQATTAELALMSEQLRGLVEKFRY